MSPKTSYFTPTWIPFDLSVRLYHSLKLLRLIPYGWDDPRGLMVLIMDPGLIGEHK